MASVMPPRYNKSGKRTLGWRGRLQRMGKEDRGEMVAIEEDERSASLFGVIIPATADAAAAAR